MHIRTQSHTAGRLGSNTRQTGEILINGHKQALAYGTSVRTIEQNNFFVHYFVYIDPTYIYIIG